MVERKEYLDQLSVWKDEQVIKVVTGLRRCGKSTLLQQYQELLRRQGVREEQIVSVNFEDMTYEPLLDFHTLYKYLKDQLFPDGMTYLFLDEIQKVDGFEKVVDSFYVQENVDIYIAGSDVYMLSGDLATLLSGRYVEISMLPLSFREFYSLTPIVPDAAFAAYMQYGGLPYLAAMQGERTPQKSEVYLEGIYNTVIVKDIEDRQRRKESDPNKRRITDIALLKTIARHLASVIGSPVSVKSVTDYLCFTWWSALTSRASSC